jgi:signal transduction histidine kinase
MQNTTKSIGVTLLLAAGCGWILTQGPRVQASSHLLIFVFCCLLLELLSKRLPYIGFASGTFLLWFAGAGHPEVGVSGCLLGIGLSLLARGVVWSGRTFEATLQSFLADAVPAAAGLSAYLFAAPYAKTSMYIPGVGAVLIFLPLHLAYSRMLQDWVPKESRRERALALEQIMPSVVAAAVLAAGAALVPLPFLVLLTLFFQNVLRAMIGVAEVKHRALLELKLKKKDETLERAGEKFDSMHRAFQWKAEESTLLQSLNSVVVKARDFEAGVRGLLGVCNKLVASNDLSFYLARKVRVIRHGQPDSNGEPKRAPGVVRACFRRRMTVQGREGGTAWQKAFVVATPVGEHGVLMLERRSNRFQDRELQLLELMARHADEALSSAHHHEQHIQTIASNLAEQEALRATISRLDLFIDAALALSGGQTDSDLFQTAARFAKEISGAQFAGVLVESDSYLSQPPLVVTTMSPLLGLATKVQARGEALLVSEVAPEDRAPLGGAGSLMMAPVKTQPAAVVWAISSQVGELNVESRQWLCLFAVLIAQAFRNLENQKKSLDNAKLAAVGKLAAGLAHEINNPLAAVSLGIQAARYSLQKKPQEADKRLAATEPPLERVKSLLARLLTATEFGAVALEMEPISFEEVVRSAVDEVEIVVQQAGLKLELSFPSELPILGHLASLQEVIINLVLNAKDSLLEAGIEEPTIRITGHTDGEHVQVSVADNGTGIPESAVSSIFEPFFTTKAPGKGTGLGLSVARETLLRHKGTLKLTKNSSTGCCFTLSIPAQPNLH